MKVFSFSDLRQKTRGFSPITSWRPANGNISSVAEPGAMGVVCPGQIPMVDWFKIPTPGPNTSQSKPGFCDWDFLILGPTWGYFTVFQCFNAHFEGFKKFRVRAGHLFCCSSFALQGTSVFGGVTFQKMVPLSYWDAWNPKRWLPSGNIANWKDPPWFSWENYHYSTGSFSIAMLLNYQRGFPLLCWEILRHSYRPRPGLEKSWWTTRQSDI